MDSASDKDVITQVLAKQRHLLVAAVRLQGSAAAPQNNPLNGHITHLLRLHTELVTVVDELAEALVAARGTIDAQRAQVDFDNGRIYALQAQNVQLLKDLNTMYSVMESIRATRDTTSSGEQTVEAVLPITRDTVEPETVSADETALDTESS